MGNVDHGRSMLRPYRLIAVAAITLLAGFLRVQAVHKLPPDFDELVYLPTAFHYQQLMLDGKWEDIIRLQENSEHPAFNKLLFAAELAVAKPEEPSWKTLDVGQPMPEEDHEAFWGPRTISTIGGTLQVLITAIVEPIGGLILALDTYHIKYSSQVYLEGIPGFFAVLSVFLFELGTRKGIQRNLVVLSAIALGLATAGKYLYGAAGIVVIVFLFRKARAFIRAEHFRRFPDDHFRNHQVTINDQDTPKTYSPVLVCVLFCIIAFASFLIADPAIWPNPPVLLWNSLTYHWHYAHSEHVVSSGMPWYAPVMFLLYSAPTAWHPGVFYITITDYLIVPLALIGIRETIRKRPIWIAWAAVGLFLLLIWPTKWPQYTLLVRTPLAVCAAMGVRRILPERFRI